MRDLRIDTLRGFFLLIVMINHLPLSIQNSIKKPFGFVSTPEGFVFISGLVAGMVYFPKWQGGKKAETKAKIRKRAGQIYLCHLLTLAILWVLVSSQDPSVYDNQLFSYMRTQPLGTLLSGVFLLYQPYLVDILPMYCIFLAMTPLVFTLFERDKAKWALGFSLGFYLLAQVPPFQKVLHATILTPFVFHLSDFNVFAWQLLFVAGLYFGCRRAKGVAVLSSSPALWVPCLLFCELCFIVSRGLLNLPRGVKVNLPALFNRTDIGFLRLLSFAAFAVLVALAARYLKDRFVMKPLAVLGRYSLSVFTWGTVLILLAWPIFKDLAVSRNYFGQALAVALLMVSLWIPPALQEWRRERIKKSEALAPVVKVA